MEWTTIILCLLAGLVAGVINTLAGSGSIITLGLLKFLGLPAIVANGTNRIGLLFQSATSSIKFYQNKQLDVKAQWKLVAITIVGAIAGVFAAIKLDQDNFEFIVGAIFCVLFFVLLFKPQDRITTSPFMIKMVPVTMFFIGFYAGFIQAGAGVFMLAIMAIVWKKDITELNPLKGFIIFCINLLALIGYAIWSEINWGMGVSLAIGQLFGALIGVQLNNLKRNIEPVLRVVLLLIVFLSILKFWGIYFE